MVAPRDSRDPYLVFLSRTGQKVIGRKCVETAARELELFGGFRGRYGMLSVGIQHVANEGRCVPFCQLLRLFKRVVSVFCTPPPALSSLLRSGLLSGRAHPKTDQLMASVNEKKSSCPKP